MGTTQTQTAPGFDFPNVLTTPLFVPARALQLPGTAGARALDASIDVGAFERGSLEVIFRSGFE